MRQRSLPKNPQQKNLVYITNMPEGTLETAKNV